VSAGQVPPHEGGPGWWLPPVAAREGVLNYRAEPVFERHSHDWYVEPSWSVDRLFERVRFEGAIHDPACGGGNIPTVARRHGYVSTGGDIADRGFEGVELGDFLASTKTRENIVSNPPYVLAEKFVTHALRVIEGRGQVAMLVRLAFLEGQTRGRRLFGPTPPARVLIFSRRPSMPPGNSHSEAKGGKTAYCWCVWEPGYLGEPRLGWLR